MTPPMSRRCRRSPAPTHSGTSPTKPFSARRLPSAPTTTSPGLIFARRPEGNSSWLYVALSVSARTTTASPTRARRRSPTTANCLCNPSTDTTDPILSASTTLTFTPIDSSACCIISPYRDRRQVTGDKLEHVLSCHLSLVTCHGFRSQPKRVELDEAFGVALVVDRVGLEGREPLLVERVRRATTDDDDVAAVELHARLARHAILRLVNRPAHQL